MGVDTVLVERAIEEALANDPEQLFPNEDPARIHVRRQVKLGPAGTADMLVVTPDGLTIVEVKRGEVDDRAVGQAVRYAGVIAHVLGQPGAFGDMLKTFGCGYEYSIELCIVAEHVGEAVLWAQHATALSFTVNGAILVGHGIDIRFCEWRGGRAVELKCLHPLSYKEKFIAHPDIASVSSWIREAGAVLWKKRRGREDAGAE